MGKVVYLTGIPGTGKSAVCEALAVSGIPVEVFSYSEHLGRHLGITKGELRSQSASVVMAEVVHAVDEELVQFTARHRSTASVVIDSHAVTYEGYGYRAVPFKPAVLANLGLDAVICLTAPATTVAERVAVDPASRKAVGLEDIERAQRLQEGIATSYAVLLGTPLYVINAAGPVADVAASVSEVLVGAAKI